MRTTIDAAGRLVIPKKIRDQARLEPGTPLDIVYENGGVRIEPAPAQIRLVRKGRFLVAVLEDDDGTVLTSEDVERTRQEIYVERERRIRGL